MIEDTPLRRRTLGVFTRAAAMTGSRDVPEATPLPLWLRIPLSLIDTIVALFLFGVTVALAQQGNRLGFFLSFAALITAVAGLKHLRRRLGVRWALRQAGR